MISDIRVDDVMWLQGQVDEVWFDLIYLQSYTRDREKDQKITRKQSCPKTLSTSSKTSSFMIMNDYNFHIVKQ